jgi:ElaB/YqjD/DUF883 family membrane-anchored ribosome-binding protein
MITNQPFGHSNNLIDRAAESADSAIRSTQRVANEALDGLAGDVQGLRNETQPMLDRAGERVSAFAHRGADAVREQSQHLRDRVHHASDSTLNYVKDEPVKAMLIAAATGAALMALVSLMVGRSRHPL